MKVNELVKAAHENAVSQGFWEKPITVGESFSLMHNEISEALEEHRNGRIPIETYYSGKVRIDAGMHKGYKVINTPYKNNPYEDYLELDKPEGIPSEMADLAIRVFDFCGYYGIDLEAAIKEKMEYNVTRPYKHGGKKI